MSPPRAIEETSRGEEQSFTDPLAMLARSRVGNFAAVLSRNMATEKQLKMRMNGTKNIAKITKSMKMVSLLRHSNPLTQQPSHRSAPLNSEVTRSAWPLPNPSPPGQGR